MNGTKFVVIKFRELVKTAVFAILGVVIIIGLIYFFLPKEEQTAVYNPGTYYAQFTLNGEMAQVEIVVDKNNIKSVSLTDTPETISVFYPLVETTAQELAKEIVKQWEKGKYTKKESIIEKLKILEKEANLYQQNIEYYKEIER